MSNDDQLKTNQPLASLQQIANAKDPEEIFGTLDGTERAGLVGSTPAIMMANIAIECSAIHHAHKFDTREPSDEILRKLWFLQIMALKKIRCGTYNRIAKESP
jgi:hypothetical protein